ncbi:MAG: hypothetical protein ACR2JU_13965 [Nocardioidaceae bacterium]
MTNPNEERFEAAICEWLAEHGGYDAVKDDLHQGDPRHFDPVRGLDTAELYAFIGATQGEEWAELVSRHGGDPRPGATQVRRPPRAGAGPARRRRRAAPRPRRPWSDDPRRLLPTRARPHT